MKQIIGNLWDYELKFGFNICITTNGFVKNNGLAVMGKGCAKEAANKYPLLPAELGRHILKEGNTPCWILSKGSEGKEFISFPVKHNWWEKADLELIKTSAEWLKKEATTYIKNIFILPRPGCGNGKLDWEEVKPLLEVLPDNVWVISK